MTTLVDDMDAAKRILRSDAVYRGLCCPKCGDTILLMRAAYICEGNYRARKETADGVMYATALCDFQTTTLSDLAVKADAGR